MKIKTEQLKAMLSKAVQGASNDKLMPLSQLIGIKQQNGVLQLTTTDGTNYLYVVESVDGDLSDELNVTPYVEQFYKLISKMTSEYVYLNIKDNGLEVKGNGTYMLELEPDEEGELIQYPDPYNDYETANKVKFGKKTLAVEDIKVLVNTLKSSISTTYDMPSITNYYLGDKILTTDKKQVACYDKRIIDKHNVLMPVKLVDLLTLMESDIKYYIADDVMLFETDGCYIYSRRGDDVEEYPKLDMLISQKYASECKVNKNDFIALLDRIALFISKHDDKAIRLYFEKDGIRVANKDRSSNEVIPYLSSKKFKAYDCAMNIDMLLDQLKAYQGDSVEIHYNNEKTIKLVNEDIIQVIALMIVQ